MALIFISTMLHNGDACTCSPIDLEEQYCDNTYVVEVVIKSSGEVKKRQSKENSLLKLSKRTAVAETPTRPSSTSSGAETVIVKAKIKNVFKGDKSTKGKKLILKSSDGMCGIGYKLRAGRHIMAFSTNKDDVNEHEVFLYMCDLFLQRGHHKLPKPRKFFKNVKC